MRKITNHPLRFKTSSLRTECTKLVIDGQSVTDTSGILNTFRSFFGSLAQSDLPLSSEQCAALSEMEASSFGNNEQILDTDICVEEIEKTLKNLKLGKSGGLDGLSPEHIVYGGEVLKIWLKKIFNRLLTLEELPDCLKVGLVVPIYKRQGKDPLLVSSYRGITLSSVLSKVLEIILLQRLSSPLEEQGFPDQLQTAYQKGVSCMDAIFATQETLTNHLRDGCQPYLCLFDIEKAFDSVELPILLQHLFYIGINGKLWRLIKNWYTNSTSRVRVNNQLSEPFTVERGVKQGLVLSPTLFLIVMDQLLKQLKEKKCGLSVCQTYAGAAIHADDLRTSAASKEVMCDQARVIKKFAEDNHLKLNASKLEVVRVSRHRRDPERLELAGVVTETAAAAKCLGVWWQYNLSASRAVHENVSKARKAFFALGNIGVFHGSLNPLSGRSIFETCIIPILLYGSETWLLDSSAIKALENFQCEIGRRILRLPKHHSKTVVRLGLQWPSVSTRILIRKLTFLAKLLSSTDDKISDRIFTSLAIVDVYNVGIVQQCRMLEADVSTNVLALCLQNPTDAPSIVKSMRKEIIRSDFDVLLRSAATHPSAKYIASVAEVTSWCRLWDLALDRGILGTRGLQTLLKVLSHRIYENSLCPSCGASLGTDSLWVDHICLAHSEVVNHLSCHDIISKLKEADMDTIFSITSFRLNCIFSVT